MSCDWEEGRGVRVGREKGVRLKGTRYGIISIIKQPF